MSILSFAEATFQRLVRLICDATEGLSEEQVFWQPSSECNPIGWLAWHLTRRKDYYSGKLVDGQQTWQEGGWFQRFHSAPRKPAQAIA